MTELTEEPEQPGGSLDALRAEHDELRRRVAVSDEEIDVLQVEAARIKRRWYRDPSVLVATIALVVSVGTFIVGQVNVISDRQIQDRHQLSTLIEQLPDALTQLREQPGSSTELVYLLASSASALINKLDPEMSTVAEKIEVATALVMVGDLPKGKQLATAAEQQSIDVLDKVYSEHIIGDIDFQAGDIAGGRDVFQRMNRLLQAPRTELDSPTTRDLNLIPLELFWASEEVDFAKSCQDAMEHLKDAKQAVDRLPPQRVGPPTTALENQAKVVAAACPAAVK